MGKNVLKCASVAMVLAASIGFSGCGSSGGNGGQSAAQTQEQKKVEYAEADITILLNDVKENAARANKNYNGKNVKIVGGVVSNIESNGRYISIDNGARFSALHVQCYPNDDKVKNAMLDLNKGQQVVVYGQISDVGEIVGYSLKMDKIEAAQ